MKTCGMDETPSPFQQSPPAANPHPPNHFKLSTPGASGVTEPVSEARKREMEVEVDGLRQRAEEAERKLREKEVEVEKSTKLFTMFD